MKRFEHKVALVTGAGAGIGRAIAMQWAADVGQCVAADLDPGATADLAASIRGSGGTAEPIQCDVRNSDALRRVVELAVERFAGLDALFNVAGKNLAKSVMR